MKIYGTHDAATIAQLERCAAVEADAPAILCADGHLGYSMPIGGVVGYREHVSPSGVGYDIACGNLAVRTTIKAADVDDDLPRIADEIQRRVSFGVGRRNRHPVRAHPVFDRIAASPVQQQRALLDLAREQLGTVGAGNHYVDLLEDESGVLWVAVHFGSRGFGYKTANGFMNIARGRRFDAGQAKGEMNAPPLVLPLGTPSGQDYVEAMAIAGEYAYAGREAVVDTVLRVLGGAQVTDRVHNHHNFAWRERHGGADYMVIRKGATPAFPSQRGFIGGSMGDISVIVRGTATADAAAALYSTVHGAGRVMSRTQAAGKRRRVRGRWQRVSRGLVDFAAAQRALANDGIILRGGGADEAPPVYRPLEQVLAAHAGTIAIEHTLRPRVVVMAGEGDFDPYKD